jgi:hypothetical protein
MRLQDHVSAHRAHTAEERTNQEIAAALQEFGFTEGELVIIHDGMAPHDLRAGSLVSLRSVNVPCLRIRRPSMLAVG